MARPIRILLLADTHLGIDDPPRPRIQRRRRGPDFFRCFREALRPALERRVDLVVHGGDLLYRRRVPPSLVQRSLEPLLEVTDQGVPVLLVPGNHERSVIPYPLLARRTGLHLFDRPRTVLLEIRGIRLALAGFPCQRKGIRQAFPELMESTGWDKMPAEARLLCLHQAVEGARVGPPEFVFRSGPDVLPGRSIPAGLTAVLTGHIHRHQVLRLDLAGHPLAAPVLYPGSIERTSFVERFEPKGYLILEIDPDGGTLHRWSFHELPARPMEVLSLPVAGLSTAQLRRRLLGILGELDPDSVVRLDIQGLPTPEAGELLRAGSLRELAPPTMNVTLRRPAP